MSQHPSPIMDSAQLIQQLRENLHRSAELGGSHLEPQMVSLRENIEKEWQAAEMRSGGDARFWKNVWERWNVWATEGKILTKANFHIYARKIGGMPSWGLMMLKVYTRCLCGTAQEWISMVEDKYNAPTCVVEALKADPVEWTVFKTQWRNSFIGCNPNKVKLKVPRAQVQSRSNTALPTKRKAKSISKAKRYPLFRGDKSTEMPPTKKTRYGDGPPASCFTTPMTKEQEDVDMATAMSASLKPMMNTNNFNNIQYPMNNIHPMYGTPIHPFYNQMYATPMHPMQNYHAMKQSQNYHAMNMDPMCSYNAINQSQAMTTNNAYSQNKQPMHPMYNYNVMGQANNAMDPKAMNRAQDRAYTQTNEPYSQANEPYVYKQTNETTANVSLANGESWVFRALILDYNKENGLSNMEQKQPR
eukprot:828978_1